MAAADVVIHAEPLAHFAASLLRAAGVTPQKAELVARSLVEANLRGVDSHGIQLLHYYLEQLEWGDMDGAAEGRVIGESGACLLYDGQNGIGQVVAEICCEHSIRLAREHGLGMAVARDSNHFGAAAHWAGKMAAVGQIGIVMCNASPIVPPWQGKEPRVGTNPICIAVPPGKKRQWLLDMATTTVAAGKIYKAALNGQENIPAGWAMDAEGVPTTHTQTALKGLIMPLGGYKGSGLAMMAEILCAVLGGGAMSTQIGGIRIRGKHMSVSQMFLAIDVARFQSIAEFAARMDELIDLIKSTPPASAAGFEEVLVAGEPETRAEAQRTAGGIPLGAGTWELLLKDAARLNVAPPAVR